MHRQLSIKRIEINNYLKCPLCKGYLIDSFTINECLHSFCKSCIVKYIRRKECCPICKINIYKEKIGLFLRRDVNLQYIVYKLAPGLFQDEMKRRRQFYSIHPKAIKYLKKKKAYDKEAIGELDEDIFLSENYSDISLSLEYSETGLSEICDSVRIKYTNPSIPKSYLQCPATITIDLLKKFLKLRFDLQSISNLDIMYDDKPLNKDFTLMDVAYIYAWRRSAPMRLFFRINEKDNLNHSELLFKITEKLKEITHKNEIKIDNNKESENNALDEHNFKDKEIENENKIFIDENKISSSSLILKNRINEIDVTNIINSNLHKTENITKKDNNEESLILNTIQNKNNISCENLTITAMLASINTNLNSREINIPKEKIPHSNNILHSNNTINMVNIDPKNDKENKIIKKSSEIGCTSNSLDIDNNLDELANFSSKSNTSISESKTSNKNSELNCLSSYPENSLNKPTSVDNHSISKKIIDKAPISSNHPLLPLVDEFSMKSSNIFENIGSTCVKSKKRCNKKILNNIDKDSNSIQHQKNIKKTKNQMIENEQSQKNLEKGINDLGLYQHDFYQQNCSVLHSQKLSNQFNHNFNTFPENLNSQNNKLDKQSSQQVEKHLSLMPSNFQIMPMSTLMNQIVSAKQQLNHEGNSSNNYSWKTFDYNKNDYNFAINSSNQQNLTVATDMNQKLNSSIANANFVNQKYASSLLFDYFQSKAVQNLSQQNQSYFSSLNNSANAINLANTNNQIHHNYINSLHNAVNNQQQINKITHLTTNGYNAFFHESSVYTAAAAAAVAASYGDLINTQIGKSVNNQNIKNANEKQLNLPSSSINNSSNNCSMESIGLDSLKETQLRISESCNLVNEQV